VFSELGRGHTGCDAQAIGRRPRFPEEGSDREVLLGKFAAAAASLALCLLPKAASAFDGYERTIEVGSTPVEVRLRYGDAAPGSTALAGEGSLATELPGSGRLTLRVPHTVGQVAALGEAQLGASYDLGPRDGLLPEVAVVALAHPALPGMRVSIAKQLRSRFLRSIHAETELRSEGPDLARSSRTSIGASFRLPAATTGMLQLVSYRPASGAAAARWDLAELALSHALGPDANLRLGLGGALSEGSASLRTQIGVELRF
jgi:hypothetical protein